MDNQAPQEDPNQPIRMPQQPVPPNKKLNWKGFLIALVIVGLLDFGALTIIHSENKTPPKPTVTPTQTKPTVTSSPAPTKQVVLPTINPTEGSNKNHVACTDEAMKCPNGTYVGRTGPKCEFVCPK